MINLLPNTDKKEIRAARINTILRRYIAILLFALLFLLAAIGLSWHTIYRAETSAKARIEESKKITADYSDTKQAADTFREHLSIAKAILDKNVVYSDLMLKIANALPYSVAINSLSLNSEAIDEPMTFSLAIQKKEDAIKLRQSLSSKVDLFSDVHIVQINEVESPSGARSLNATISVTLAKGVFDDKTEKQ